VDITSPAAVAAAIDDKTRCVYCETVSNSTLEITQLDEIAVVAHMAGLPLVVDDTFTTPHLCRPIDHGADIVVHSLIKWKGGHGNGIGGFVVDSGTFNWAAGKHPLFTDPDASHGGLRWGLDLPPQLTSTAFLLRLRAVPLGNLGACISSDDAEMFLQALDMLALRMDRHCENATRIAEFLLRHNKVEWVKYPGLVTMFAKNLKFMKGKGGSLIVFQVKGGSEAAKKFISALRLVSYVEDIADAKSLAINSTVITHLQLQEEQRRLCGIAPGTICLSVGIETCANIQLDIAYALESIDR
jgi:O-acetylhomoserine (thiol)-lyase